VKSKKTTAGCLRRSNNSAVIFAAASIIKSVSSISVVCPTAAAKKRCGHKLFFFTNFPFEFVPNGAKPRRRFDIQVFHKQNSTRLTASKS
jgi:hypothetical protein